jgi:hypothetical protein
MGFLPTEEAMVTGARGNGRSLSNGSRSRDQQHREPEGR